MTYTPDTFSNDAITTVAGGSGGVDTSLNATDTTLEVPTGKGALFPTGNFMVRLGGVGRAKCTVRSGDTLTLVRGQNLTAPDGPTSADPTWPVGTTVEQIVTAGNLTNFATAISTLNTSVSSFAATQTKINNYLTGVYDVLDYGAVGDGVTDDRAAIQAALDACRGAGGGTVWFPAKTFLLATTAANAEDNTKLASLFVGSNTKLLGASAGASILKFGAAMGDQARMLYNYHINTGDDTITLESLTLDGNAANQAAVGTDCQYGAVFTRVRGLRVLHCRFKDVYGTNAGGNGAYGTQGEGFHTSVGFCDDVEYVNCEVLATSAATSSGFSANSSNNIRYLGCWAHDMGIANGFTHNTVSHIKHVGCVSYKNAKYGFNSESSTDVSYDHCQAGGKTAAVNTYKFTSGTNLGNSDSGFVINSSGSVWLTGCESMGNTNYGLWVPNNVGPIIVSSGEYSNNGQYGMTLSFPAQVRLLGRPYFTGNTTAKIRCPSLNVDPDTTLPTPTIPATTVALTNPYPFPCTVAVGGGTVTALALDGTASGLTTNTCVRVPHGGTITLTYSVSPGWHWWTD